MAAFERVLRVIGASAALAALLSVPASAEQADLSPHGDYDFRTFAQKDGHPVCTERWQFNDDGTLVVHSGEEIITEQFHIKQYRAGTPALYLIVTNTVSTNGLADCLGRAVTKPGQTGRTLSYPGLNGGIVLCWPPASDDPPAEGEMFALSAYGRLDPAPAD